MDHPAFGEAEQLPVRVHLVSWLRQLRFSDALPQVASIQAGPRPLTAVAHLTLVFPEAHLKVEALVLTSNFQMNANVKDKPKLRVAAKHIGPIMELDAELSDGRQHLMFARTGTGKSFIARALRLLDPASNERETEEEIPGLLVSEESISQQATFGLYEGEKCIGSIDLNAKAGTVNRSVPSYIFHVFSEDFVEAHVRNRLHDLDGNISHEIIVGKENTDIDAKNEQLDAKQKEAIAKRSDIDTKFENGKRKLKSDFNIAGSLGAFKQLITDTYLKDQIYTPPDEVADLSALLKQYNLYKSLPTDPELPIEVDIAGIMPDASSIAASLEQTTSPSSVANKFKDLIRRDPQFYERGVALSSSDGSSCPFCTQDLNEKAIQAIDAYTNFFGDEEAKHVRLLNQLQTRLTQQDGLIKQKRLQTQTAKVRFDDLKKYFPSLADNSVNDLSAQLDNIQKYIKNLQGGIIDKLANLTVSVGLPNLDSEQLESDLIKRTVANKKLYDSIAALTSNSNAERLSIQNTACGAFVADFFVKGGTLIGEARGRLSEIQKLKEEIAALQKEHGDSAPARERVVETFQLLLRQFFADSYTFDADTFSVRRNHTEIARGPDRTLSDGEKSVIAFCYYIARIHLRVGSLQDYEKLFLIIDDPVSSLSFDYIYAIAQCLKYLRISNDGQVLMSLEPQPMRPRMIILSHNNYFYNVISTNNVVKGNGLFQLIGGSHKHELRNQKAFATPHVLQLRDVFDVSKGIKTPDHTTPNSIRSVIESMWKFCRPDIQSFEDFVKHLISDHSIEVKSVLLNDLCHGGKFSDPPHQEAEIIAAAKEALMVVEAFAAGQIKLCG